MNEIVDICGEFYGKLFDRMFVKPACALLQSKQDQKRVKRQIEELGDAAAESLARFLENKPFSPQQASVLTKSFQSALKKQKRESFPNPSALEEAVAKELLAKHKLPQAIIDDRHESSFRLAFTSVVRVLILASSTLAEWEKVRFPRDFEKLKGLIDTIRKWAESLDSMSTDPSSNSDRRFENTYRNELLQRAYRVDVGALRVGASQAVDIRDLFVRPKLNERNLTLLPQTEGSLELDVLSLENARKAIQSRTTSDSNEQEIATDAVEFLQSKQRIVIVGLPGGGNSTLVEWLQVMLASGELGCTGGGDPAPVPLLLRVRQFPDGIPPEIKQFVSRSFHSGDWASEEPDGWTRRYLELQRVLLIVDGLDETSEHNRKEKLLPWLESLINEYPHIRIVVTSRPAGYPIGWLKKLNFAECDLAPFDGPQTLEFAQHWHTAKLLSDNKSIEEAQRIGEAEGKSLYDSFADHTHVRDLARSPLMLAAVCLVHHFEGGKRPDDRALLYKLCVEGMLHNWDQRRGIESHFGLEEKLRCCRQLAIEMQIKATAECTLDDVKASFTKELGNPVRANQLLENIRQRAGILIERRTNVFAFAHLTFQEYLAALAIHQGGVGVPLASQIVKESDDGRWQEVIPLYCGVATRNEVSTFLKSLASQSDSPNLGFILCESYGTAAREVGRDLELHDLVAARALRSKGFSDVRVEVFQSDRLRKLVNETVHSLEDRGHELTVAFEWLLFHPDEINWNGIAVRLKKTFVSEYQFLETVHLIVRFASLDREELWTDVIKTLKAVVIEPKLNLVRKFAAALMGMSMRNSADDLFYYPSERLSKRLSRIRHLIYVTLLDCVEVHYEIIQRGFDSFDWPKFAELLVIDTEPGSASLQEQARRVLRKELEFTRKTGGEDSILALKYLSSNSVKQGKAVTSPSQPRTATRKNKKP